jgi:predicted dithiol-disulfide oxidoreductase (DUF899 family)
MQQHRVASREEWLEARKELLDKEKALTRLRDHLAAERRKLPWVKVEKPYVFETDAGKATLADLFEGRSQLIVYHFMYGPDWEEGCPSCSFWADSFNGIVEHLKARDVTMIAVSRAPYPALKKFQKRMGWSFNWVSSLGSDFNYDFHVSFTPEEQEGKVFYNFEKQEFPSDEAPGISVFAKDEQGALFHTYSTFGRGIDMMNTAYNYLDLVPKGRDEADLPGTMSWVKLRDLYDR